MRYHLFSVLCPLSFSWDEPELNYNVEPIQQYQAHLALEPLDPDSEGDATASFSVSTINAITYSLLYRPMPTETFWTEY